jgi:signal transduction histidine kinase
MTDRTSTRLAWGLFLGGIAALMAASLLDVADRRPGQFVAANVTQLIAFLAIGLAGLAVARRQPANAIGWIYLGVWDAVAIVFALVASYGYWATIAHPGSPGGTFAVWIGNWLWVPVFSTLLTFPFLLFPDGHLPSPRWRPVPWAVVVVTVAWSLAFAMENHDYTDALDRSVPNPFAIRALTPFFNVGREVLAIGFLITLGLSIASMVVRFRRSRGDERQQIKWVIFAASVLLVWLALPLNHGSGGPADTIQGFVLALIPASVGVAIVKYHLYDIDVVIKKTVVFAVVAGVLTALYLAVVALATVGTASRVLVGVLLLVVTFNPVRRAARSLADRLVYGRRATSYEVLSDFSQRMADTYATDDVLPRMAQILRGATGATSATVWLHVGPEIRPAASSGDRGPTDALRTPEGALPELPDDFATEVRHQGELLGALSVGMPTNDPMDPGREKLVRDLASQAGLVLRNVRLIEELRASRQRLVAAQDEERRKLERNIHDGAQQQLVALSVQLKLLEQMVARDPPKARELSVALQASAVDALEDLRDLARGIYPPLLADKGLAAALEAQARKAPVSTTVESDGIGRYDQDVEATVYFCTLEALQNVAKYANATSATVVLAQANGSLTFQVSDDGAGFDASSTRYGTGLQGMADRLDAVGGSLSVRSVPGEGTSVIGVLPASALPEIET